MYNVIKRIVLNHSNIPLTSNRVLYGILNDDEITISISLDEIIYLFILYEP